jgi:hypothetical protein
VFEINVNDKEMMGLAVDVAKLSKFALPYAVAGALDGMAASARARSVAGMKTEFTLRNTYTVRSVTYRKSIERKVIGSMESEVGSPLDYLAKQEGGFTRSKGGKYGVTIPTAMTAGQTKRRTRPQRMSNKMKNIQLRHTETGKRIRPKQSLLVATRMAVNTGSRYFFSPKIGNYRAGIYRVVGGTKGPRNRGWPKGASLELMHDLSKATITTPPHAWLGPATMKANEMRDELFKDALRKQIKMRGLFKGRGGK